MKLKLYAGGAGASTLFFALCPPAPQRRCREKVMWLFPVAEDLHLF